MTDDLCGICKRPLDDLNDPTTESCGGDCLKCMAEVGEDPDCIISMQRISIEAQAAEIEKLRHDVSRQMDIANEQLQEVEKLRQFARNVEKCAAHGLAGDWSIALHDIKREVRKALEQST